MYDFLAYHLKSFRFRYRCPENLEENLKAVVGEAMIGSPNDEGKVQALPLERDAPAPLFRDQQHQAHLRRSDESLEGWDYVEEANWGILVQGEPRAMDVP